MGIAHDYREVKFEDVRLEAQLNKNITVAPLHQSYALCVEYMRHWFLEKFDKDFFSWVHTDGSNVFGEMANLDKKKILSHMTDDKATLTIIPAIDDDYNRDRLDQNLFGLDQFINTTSIDKAFLQDPVNHKYIMMNMDMMLMTFTYRIKVPSRAIQLDTQKFMKLAFRENLSETKDVDLDYVLPYPMMLFIAKDLGFEVKDDRICEPIKFLTYLNSRSYIPITYKRSNVNAREEYFVRVDHLPIRVLTKDVTKDDGNKYGHVADDFGIEMQAEVRFPAMQLFIYFTREDFTSIKFGKEVYNINNTLMMSLHYYDDPPAINDKGWPLTINAQWEEDKPGKINIDLNELFDGELSMISNYLLKKFISPAVFLDVQLYSGGMKLNTNIDWDDMKLYAENPTDKLVSTIAIYIDLTYLNSMRVESYGGSPDKINPSLPNRSY
jgi:hypothetical protein